MSDANWEAFEDSRGPSPLLTCGTIMNYIGRSKPSGGRCLLAVNLYQRLEAQTAAVAQEACSCYFICMF